MLPFVYRLFLKLKTARDSPCIIAGILSAYGMALADVVHEAQEPSAKFYTAESYPHFTERLRALGEQCRNELRKQGFSDDNIELENYLHLRYDGTDCALMCASKDNKNEYEDFLSTFLERYNSEFGFIIQGRGIVVDDIRVRGVGKSYIDKEEERPTSSEKPLAKESTQVYFEGGYQSTGVFLLRDLSPGHIIKGPAIIMDQLSTILVEPDCTATITKYGDTKITIGSGIPKSIGTELDSIQLSIFSHRFMSIAEQMGR